MAYQNVYDITPLSKAQPKLAFLPVTVDCGSVKTDPVGVRFGSLSGHVCAVTAGKVWIERCLCSLSG